METTSNLKEELAEIDAKLKEFEKSIEMGEALDRLHKNEDFALVIISGFFESEKERIADVLTTPTRIGKDIYEILMEKLSSIRHLKEYIGAKFSESETARMQIEELEAYRREVTARHGAANKTLDVEAK
jgi:hypothetical protein